MRRILTNIVVTLGAIGVVLWLLQHVDAPDRTHHQRLKNDLLELSALDARLNQDFMECRFGLASINYDRINLHLQRAREVRANILASAERIAAGGQGEVLHAVKRYEPLAEHKEALIETVKSETSVLANSMYYLRQDQSTLDDSGLPHGLQQALRDLVDQLLFFVLDPGSNGAARADVEADVERLLATTAAYPPAARAIIQRMVAHTHLILRNSQLLHRISQELLQLPSGDMIDGIAHLNSDVFEQDTRRAEWNRAMLGLFSLVLLGFVVYFVLRYQQAAESLRQSMRQLQLQKNALDRHAIVSFTDGAGRITYANEKFCEASGYTMEELLGQDHRLLNSGLHSKAFFELMWYTLERGEIWQGEICNRSKSGDLYWVNSTIVPFMDAAGRPQQYISMRTDITAQKRMETAAREQERFLRQVLDNQSVATILLDASHRVLFWNRACEKLTGLPAAEIIGKAEAWRGFYPAPRPCLADLVLDAQQHAAGLYYPQQGASTLLPEGWHAESWFDNLGGQRRYVIFDAAPIFDAQGAVVAAIETLLDVTAAKQGEEAVAQARDAALETARVKSEFLSTMSHEIRTPMNGVIGMAQLLLDTPLDNEQVEFATAIRESGQALLAIINDILDFSKIEAGRLEIENTHFSLQQVVEGSADLIAARAHEKFLSLTSFVDPGLPDRLMGDPTRVRQILLNFLTNAIKFTEAGEVVLRAQADGHDDAGQDTLWVRFEVRDSGIGIAENVQARLFQPFSQADSSTTRKYGGTGLGLSISKRLVDLMGGEIGLHSHEGVGSTFWVRLPFRIALDNEQKAQPQAAAADANTASILLAGDSAENQAGFLAYLTAWGVRAQSAAGLGQARQMLSAAHSADTPFDLLLLLQPLPDASLLEALREVHAMPGMHGLPVLTCLATQDTHLKSELAENGAAAVLLKPVKRSALYDAIAGALQADVAVAMDEAPTTLRMAAPIASKALEHNRLILLAEDNQINQQVAVRMLNKLGYAAHVVSNGQEAIDALECLPYALVLMDCQMPVMDGFEATHTIRRRESGQGARIPIVAITANAMQGDRERCLAAGMDDYLSKPIDAVRLKEVLETWIPAAAAGASAAPQAAPPAPAAQDAPIALSRLHEFLGDDADAIAELLQVFAQSLRHLQERLKKAVQERNPDIKALAHELKGSAANMGALPLAELAKAMERAAHDGHWPAIEALHMELDKEIEHVGRYIADRSAG